MLIYEIINKFENKSYVGKYSKCDSNEEFQKSRYWGSGIYIKNAIKEHGKENFEKKVLIRGIQTFEELEQKEKFCIRIKNTKYPNGYNLTDGGDGLINPSEKTRERIHEAMKYFYSTSEGIKRRKEISELMVGPNNPNWHKPMSEETKIKISEKMRGNKNPMCGIHKYGKDNPNYGNLWTDKQKEERSEKIKDFYSTSEGEKKKREISKTLKGFYQTSEGKKLRKKKSEKMKGKFAGEGNPRATLKKEDVIQIREFIKEERLSNKEIMNVFNLTENKFYKTKYNRTWRNI